jgi:hypothetical protein
MKKIHSSHDNLASDWGITQVRFFEHLLHEFVILFHTQLAKEQASSAASAFAEALVSKGLTGDAHASLEPFGNMSQALYVRLAFVNNSLMKETKLC